MKSIPMLLIAAVAVTGCASTPELATLPAIPEAVSPAPGIVSGGRLGPAEISRLHDAGIRHVIDLTVNTETPDFDEGTAVRATGIRYSNLPISGALDLTKENVQAFDALVRTADRPLLVHCASGNRVGAMAALRAAWVDGHNVDEAIAIGRTWGLKGLEPDVRRRLIEGADAMH